MALDGKRLGGRTATLLCVALLAGCGGGGPAGDSANRQPVAEEDKVAQGANSAETVPIVIADWDGMQAMVAKQHGKVAVVDLWTTW
jgi:hypothetical protein